MTVIIPEDILKPRPCQVLLFTVSHDYKNVKLRLLFFRKPVEILSIESLLCSEQERLLFFR